MSPVHRTCPHCEYGRIAPDWRICVACDGLGYLWVDGGPTFGCKLVLADRKRGEVVTLGNGDRGRVVRHVKRGEPTTLVALIDDLFETEAEDLTVYPSSTGVRSSLPSSGMSDNPAGRARSRQDQVDPLQRETKAL